MPTYEYECNGCGYVFEKDGVRIKDRHEPAPCPRCRKRDSKLLISRNTFNLTGTGWYQTDYKNQGK